MILERDDMVVLFRGLGLLGPRRYARFTFTIDAAIAQKVHRKFQISLERHARSVEQDSDYHTALTLDELGVQQRLTSHKLEPGGRQRLASQREVAPKTEPLATALDWQDECEHARSKTAKRKDIEASVDSLLATEWQWLQVAFAATYAWPSAVPPSPGGIWRCV